IQDLAVQAELHDFVDLAVAVRGPERLVLRDEQRVRARAAELVEKRAVLVEDLDPLVLAVRDEETALGVDRNRVDNVELTGTAAALAELAHVLPVLRKPDDASVLVAVGDVEVAARQERDVGRSAEVRPIGAGHLVLTEPHDELAVAREFEHLLRALAGPSVDD